MSAAQGPVLVGIGLDGSLGSALAEACRRRNARWWTSEVDALPAGASVLLTAARDPESIARADRAAAAVEAALLPVTVLGDDQDVVRIGDFNSREQSGRDAVALAAGALARAGLPVGATVSEVLRVAAEAGHLVPVEAGALRTVCLVLQALAHPCDENHDLVVDLLQAALTEEPWTGREPRRHPRHGFWAPETGVTERLDGLAAGDGPITVVAVSRNQVCSGNDDHLHELWGSLQAQHHRVLGWFGRTEDLLTDLDGLLDRVGVWINTRSYTLTGGDGSPELDQGTALLDRLGTIQLSALVLTAQTRQEWEDSAAGVSPATLAHQIAIPELQGGVAPIVIATRAPDSDRIAAVGEQCDKLARLARRWLDLADTPAGERELAIVLVAHDADKGKVGTASMLDVWESLWRWLRALAERGYDVEVPDSAQDLLAAVLSEPEDGAPATHPRVLHEYHAGDYLADYAHAERVVTGRGPAPGEFDTDGVHLFVHGARFGRVSVICQPSFGYGSDPATLLFNPDASPTHSFAATYTWISQHLKPDAILHFGTHGALEFMPGTQVGLKPYDYSDHLIGNIPHLYLYVASNPSEAAIARRRSYATIVNHLNPPLARSDLYGDLEVLRGDVRALLAATDPVRRDELWAQIRDQAAHLGLDADVDPAAATADPGQPRTDYLNSLFAALDEVAESLIALGLHILGEGVQPEQAGAILAATAEMGNEDHGLVSLLDDPRLPGLVKTVVAGGPVGDHDPEWYGFLTGLRDDLAHCTEIESLLDAHDGRYVLPGPGGDPVRHRAMLPTGRNTYSVDPLRIPTARAVRRGRQQAEALLAHARVDPSTGSGGVGDPSTGSGDVGGSSGDGWPETVSLVVWGIDTIKTLGEAPAQAFAMLGVEPYPDRTGEVNQLRVIPLSELGRPRIDVVIATSGVFRDMFPATLDLLDRAVHLVAALDESDEDNYLRKHCRETATELGISVDEAATRVFSSLQGRYGTGVSHTVEASAWDSDTDLGEIYLRRQGHAYGAMQGREAVRLLRAAMARVEVSFQNIDGAEQSLADNDDYLDHLGGMTAAVAAASGGRRPRVLTADNYSARAKVRDLDEAIRLESRTRMLNPKWYEAMLSHGFQGVHEVASRLSNTYGWSATTGAVDGWIFSAAAQTFLFDSELSDRMVALNPAAVRAMADTLAEARDRELWQPDASESDRLDEVRDDLDDHLEGVA